jgi:hypothetical protein
LVNARCDGSAHGSCQARCSIFWKTAWLKPLDAVEVLSPEKLSAAQHPADGSKQIAGVAEGGVHQQERYTCQYTEVAAASTQFPRWGIGRILRPLYNGNVTFAAFVVALLTWLFNWVQDQRGGIAFPEVPNSGLAKTPVLTTNIQNIQANDNVRVLAMKEIGLTLDKTSRNRGLWFDREMTKHCGQPYRVLQRVEKIIDDATGRIVPMKTPCIMLEDSVASGEFLQFCAQQEYLFWRESWLRVDSV